MTNKPDTLPEGRLGAPVGQRHEFEYEETDCANCNGEGFTYGCSWDWQCDTYNEGEGTCLCTRPCDWCSPRKPDPELRQVLADLLNQENPATLAQDATS